MTNNKRIVLALGGNALGNTLPEQMEAVKTTASAIVDLIEEGHEVVIVHGNGPQVGIINNAMVQYAHATKSYVTPLSVCVAMSQAYIGYDLQNALREEFLNRGMAPKPVATMVTQIRVDEDDPAFTDPSKPIGEFMGREEALQAAGERGIQRHAGKDPSGARFRRGGGTVHERERRGKCQTAADPRGYRANKDRSRRWSRRHKDGCLG